MHKILVSVIITTCNRSQLLQRAIRSVSSQHYQNLEIIIVDDCSSDNTKQVVEEFQKLDNRIIYICNETPSGANVSRNKGLMAASGKFIAGLDDDDEFTKDRIGMLLAAYDESFAFITTWNIVVKNNSLKEYRKMPLIVTRQHMLDSNVLMNQALIEKKRLFDVGMYDENLSACQDYDMWLRLIFRYGHVATLPVYTQIIHEDDPIERISTSSKKKFSGYLKFYTKYKYLLDREQRKTHLFRLYDIKNRPISKGIKILLDASTKEEALYRYLQYRISLNDQRYIDYVKQKAMEYCKFKRLIVYGYGTFGKIFVSQLAEQVVGIIDRNLQVSSIDGVDVISLDSLEGREFEFPIIITPFLFFDEISAELYAMGAERVLKFIDV